MNNREKTLSALVLIAFMLIPVSFIASAPHASAAPMQGPSVLSEGYSFKDRTVPVDVGLYIEWTDMNTGGEYDYVMQSIVETYGNFGMMQLTNITDYTNLESMIGGLDVLLVIEQEDASASNMDTVAAAWSPFLESWVADGGVLIVMGYWEGSGVGTTHRLLNETGILPIYNATVETGTSMTVVDDTDPLAFGVPAPFAAPDGSVTYNVADGNIVFGCCDAGYVVHKLIGTGHVVMLGFDMFSRTAPVDTILSNALKLNRVMAFDISHFQYGDPRSDLLNFSQSLSYDGFAIKTLEVFDEAWIETSQVLFIGVANVDGFTSGEVTFVQSFVENGGGLLVPAEWGAWGMMTSPILNAFGYAYDQREDSIRDSDEYGGDTFRPIYHSENIGSHAVTFGVSSLQMFAGTILTTLPDNAETLVWTDTDGTANWTDGTPAPGAPLVACSTFGRGRVLVTADYNMFGTTDYDSDGIFDFFDEYNERFGVNAARWLSAAGISEKSIVIDTSHNPYISLTSGKYDSFAAFLTYNGFNIRVMSTFNSADIEAADVVMIISGAVFYNTTEQQVMSDYVAQGGGVFAIGDFYNYGAGASNITSVFGIEYNTTMSSYISESDDYDTFNPYYILDDDNFASHPIMTGVHRMEFDKSGAFATVGSGVALARTDIDGTATWASGGIASGVAVLAATTFGFGRVVAVTDLELPSVSNPEGDEYITLYDSDNDIFLANAFYWLIENRAPIVEIVTPNGGEVLNGTRQIEWTAVDPDSDSLTYSVFVSNNNGSSYTEIASGLTTLTYLWNTTEHADGTGYMIRVVAFDGSLYGQDDSDAPFELNNSEEVPVGPGFDPTLLAIIGGALAVAIVVIVVFMKRSGRGK
ncbi:MAG: hypothetical protein ACP6KW_10700 [Candidatus Thorarchaeota archaeon]